MAFFKGDKDIPAELPDLAINEIKLDIKKELSNPGKELQKIDSKPLEVAISNSEKINSTSSVLPTVNSDSVKVTSQND